MSFHELHLEHGSVETEEKSFQILVSDKYPDIELAGCAERAGKAFESFQLT